MKVLLTATVQSHICQFHRSLVEMLHADGYQVDVAARNNLAEKSGLKLDFADNVFDVCFARSPRSTDNIRAYRQIRKILDEGDYDIVHCNTPMGGIVTRLAARKIRRSGVRVFYTAHGFHFYKGAPLKNWLLYYPAEKLCAHFTDALITINREDYALAKRKMKARQVVYVPGVGIDVNKFKNTVIDRAAKRRELGIPKDAFLVLSVGELNENKNHQIVIRALAEVNDPSIHYAIAGNGMLAERLTELAAQLGVADRVHLLGYRRDVAELYKAADVDVFPSVREGLGLAAVEGMAAGLPLICSDNRGTRDYAVNGVNALVCDSVSDYSAAIHRLYTDCQLREEMGRAGSQSVARFSANEVNREMMRVYGVGCTCVKEDSLDCLRENEAKRSELFCIR